MLRCTGSFIKLWTTSQKIVWKRTTFNSNIWSSFSAAESDVTRSTMQVYRQCLQQNPNIYTSMRSKYARTKYNAQHWWDNLVHGKKEKASAQVAFMITNDMKQGLADLGFPVKEVGSLKPAYAQLILNKSISYAKWKSDSATLIREYEEEEEKRRKEAKEEAQRLAAEELAKQQPVAEAEASEQPATSQLAIVPESTSETVLDMEEPKTTSPESPSLMVVEEEKKENTI